MSLTLVLVVQDPLAREGLAAVLRAEGADVHPAEAPEAEDVAQAVGAGAVVTDRPLTLDGDMPVLVLVTSAAEASAALRLGAYGVLRRSGDGPRLAAAARAVVLGLRVVDDAFPDLLRLPDLEAPDVPVTPREEEVLLRLAEGWSNARIAKDLGLAERTVKFHVNQLMSKLGARTRTDVVVRAARAGVLWL